jgi:hypothetical protein
MNFHCQKLFKIQYHSQVVSKNIQITFIESYSLEAFQQHQERGKRCPGLGGLNLRQTNKTNNLPSFIDRLHKYVIWFDLKFQQQTDSAIQFWVRRYYEPDRHGTI